MKRKFINVTEVKMKTLNKKNWQYEKHGIDGEVELFGVNIFNYRWKRI